MKPENVDDKDDSLENSPVQSEDSDQLKEDEQGVNFSIVFEDDDADESDADKAKTPIADDSKAAEETPSAQSHEASESPANKHESNNLADSSLHVASQTINRHIRKLRKNRFEQYPILAFNKVTYTLRHERYDLLNKIDWSFYNSRVQSVLIHSDDERRAVVALAAGMRTPNKGTITFHGKDIQEMEPNEFRRHNIGVLFEHFNLRSELTASENIVLTMDVSGRNFLKPMPVLAAELLNKVSFPDDQFDTPVGQLSVLNQRKAQLARALSCDASIILADEPTLGLNDDDTACILDTMRFLADKQSKCLIIVTADEDLAAQTDAIVSTDD